MMEGWTFTRTFVCAHCGAQFLNGEAVWAHIFAKHLPPEAT